MPYFAGLDWASAEHAVCVVDDSGIKLASFLAKHTAEGLATLLRKLAAVAPAEEMPIAIERPSGLLIDMLIDAGHPVVPIHPNALKACRPRYSAAGGKSDAGDAFILADVLRTDGHRFRPLQPLSDEIRALRAMTRTRDDLVTQRVAQANQLRSLLESFWPGATGVFADIDSPIALAFLERYPTPASASRLGEKRMAAFLARHAYSGRRSPHELLARLKKAPTGLAGAGEEGAKGAMVRALVAVLRVLVAEIKKATASIEHTVAQLEIGQVMMSFPRAGKLNAAQVVAEIGDISRFPSEDQLAAEAGVAPVTHASGKRRSVVFRYACNKRLRQALTCFAGNSRHSSPWAKHVYAQARARGCDHSHAVRILARAWVRVLWRCLVAGTPYELEHHGGAARYLAA